jgi:hypothetical protein
MKNKAIKILSLAAVLTFAAGAASAQGLYSRRAESAPVASSPAEERAGIYSETRDDSGILRAGGTEGGGNSNKITDETIPLGGGMHILFAGSLLYLLLAGKRSLRAGGTLPQRLR